MIGGALGALFESMGLATETDAAAAAWERIMVDVAVHVIGLSGVVSILVKGTLAGPASHFFSRVNRRNLL